MTSQEIYARKFEKAVGGYKAEDVNRFLADVGAHVEGLEAEIEDLQEKLYTLAEKLEEYRADEDSLRAAIVGAQKLGDSVVRESKQKAEIIITEAVKKAEEILIEARKKSDSASVELKRSMATESYTVERLKAESTKFRRQLLAMYEKQVTLVHSIPHDESAGLAEPVRPAHLAQAAPAAAAPPEEDSPPPEEGKLEFTVDEPGDADDQSENDERPRRRFGTLMFGEDYDLVRKE
ncbi:MAG: DivIVA domain-containing protein [Oscillospiraceae bacterium]|nr:DivIVA domain-containing protein [Oscillospiraceae bacterium]